MKEVEVRATLSVCVSLCMLCCVVKAADVNYAATGDLQFVKIDGPKWWISIHSNGGGRVHSGRSCPMRGEGDRETASGCCGDQ
jgi:hypothetical protein